MQESIPDFDGSEIAIIGMSCRFPRANRTEEFWENLRNGTECISFLAEEELELSGVDAAIRHDPNYVRAASILEDVERFDASFFGVTPPEAQVMDPQHRLFLQSS